MSGAEHPAAALRGDYHDVLFDHGRRIRLDSGVRPNAIVADCRRLLAARLAGKPASTALLGLDVGAGLPQWDTTGPPPATAGQTALVDLHPYRVPAANLTIDFLTADTGEPSDAATNRLQIQAALGPGEPNWPDANHPSGNLREFGLVAELDGKPVLIDYVTHPVIAKDPASTLQRTIWLTF